MRKPNIGKTAAKSGEKLCVECSLEIPSAAIKCHKCGAYQNWRRHLNFWQSSIAILLAFIAVITGFYTFSTQALVGISAQLFPSEFDIDIGIVQIDANHISLIATSRRADTVVLASVTCVIFAPIDNVQFSRGTLEKSGEVSSGGWPKIKDTIGSFFIDYQIDKSVVLAANQQTTFSALRHGILPPVPGISESNDEAISYCFINGVDYKNIMIGAGVQLRPIDLLGFSSITLIENAIFDGTEGNYSKERKKFLLDHINDTTTANKADKNGPTPP